MKQVEAVTAEKPLEIYKEDNIDAPLATPMENQKAEARPAIILAAQPEPKPAIETRTAEERVAEPVHEPKTPIKKEKKVQAATFSSGNRTQAKRESEKPLHTAKAEAVVRQPKKKKAKAIFTEKPGRRKLDWLEKVVIPNLGGWNRVALGVAGGLIGAGYIGGNPSTPSGYEASNYIETPQKPMYADPNMTTARIGNNQEGYIVNINAKADNHYGDNRVQNIIGNAVTNTYSNNTVTINTNINHREDYMSAQDLYDYLALSL